LIIAESLRPRQRQRKGEHIDRSTTSPTHSRYSKSQMAGARRNGGTDPLMKGDWHAQAHGKHTFADAARPGYTRRTTSEAHWIQAIGEPSVSAERSLCIQAMQHSRPVDRNLRCTATIAPMSLHITTIGVDA
jgi:hypothetical protein